MGLGGDAPGAGESEPGSPRRRPGGGSAAFAAFRERVKARFPELAEKLSAPGGRGLMDPDVRAAIDSDEELKADLEKITAGMRGRGPRSGGGRPGGGGPADRGGAGGADAARPEGPRDR
jgi:hypothetical protein